MNKPGLCPQGALCSTGEELEDDSRKFRADGAVMGRTRAMEDQRERSRGELLSAEEGGQTSFPRRRAGEG